jgi:putative hydrolase of the HAD superfamily
MVFDLDDTLYLERDFVRSGFRAASTWFERETGTAGLEALCIELFEAGQRTQIFDAALEALGVGGGDAVARLVEIYRSHAPDIALAADAERYLRRRAAGRRYALITDGPEATQMAKVQALGLGRLLDEVICTGAWGRDFWKPHPRAFEVIEARSGGRGAEVAYIADNPGKDFVTPRARGWWTVQIARPERVHHVPAPDAEHEAHAIIASLDALDDCLADLLAAGPDEPAGG